MQKVTLDKVELLGVLRQNREKHVTEFKEADTGYREAVVEALEKTLAAVRAGEMTSASLMAAAALRKPENHTKDYDRAIRMLEMSQDPTLVLEEEDFSQYVLDEWNWKEQFVSSTLAYNKLR